MRDERGLGSLLLLVFLCLSSALLAAVALELGRATTAKAALDKATDAAALAAAERPIWWKLRTTGTTEIYAAQAQAAASAAFAANREDLDRVGATPGRPVVSVTGSAAEVTATAILPTSLFGPLQISSSSTSLVRSVR